MGNFICIYIGGGRSINLGGGGGGGGGGGIVVAANIKLG